MNIALGSDHRGDGAVADLAARLGAAGHEVNVLGATGPDCRDYTDVAWLVARAVAGGAAERGVLVCGSGIGMSMAANKVPGVRAALAADAHDAEMSRRHNDANVLCLSAERRSAEEIAAIVDHWLGTDFEGGRHARRIAKMTAIERGEDPAAIEMDTAAG